MPVTLLIADISVSPAFAPPAHTSALAAARARSHIATTAGSTLEDTLLAEFSFNGAQTDLAGMMARVDVPARLPAIDASQCWLRADPVHLAVSRDNVQLLDSHAIAPQAPEMAAIAKTLNAHFAQDNLHFVFPDPARGYVAIDRSSAPQTTPLWQMQGTNVFEHMPRSQVAKDAGMWRARMNEIQMLLHDHPVNVARESRGEHSINGLWFWGAAPSETATPMTIHSQIIARLLLARGLASISAIPQQALTEKFDLTAISPGANTLIVLHIATRELRALSPGGWLEAVSDIDRNWVAPAVAAFDSKKIDTLRIIVANETSCEQMTLSPLNWFSSLRRAWQSK